MLFLLPCCSCAWLDLCSRAAGLGAGRPGCPGVAQWAARTSWHLQPESCLVYGSLTHRQCWPHSHHFLSTHNYTHIYLQSNPVRRHAVINSWAFFFINRLFHTIVNKTDYVEHMKFSHSSSALSFANYTFSNPNAIAIDFRQKGNV